MQSDTDKRSGRTQLILRWWSPPAALRKERRRIWFALAVAAFALTVTVSATSLWNYNGLSLPGPGPTSNISASIATVPALPPVGPHGTVEWTFDAGQPLSAPATPDGEAVLVVSGTTPKNGTIASLSTSDGSVNWSIKLNSLADYSPVAAGNLVFVGTRAGYLLALDRDTGATIWTADLESSVLGAPIVDEGGIYIASKSVFAIDAATGRQLWRHEVGGDVSRPLRSSAGVIAAISSDGNVNLINASNGRRRLTFPLWFSTSAAPAVSDTTLVIPGDRAFAQALEITERDVPMEKAMRYWWTKLWLWDMAPRPPLPRAYLWQNRELGGDRSYALGADEGAVYIGVAEADLSGKLVALDVATGEAKWTVATVSRILDPAILAGQSVIAGTERDGIVAVDKSTGALLWELPAVDGLGAAPALTAKGLLLVPTAGGLLRAIR